MGTFLIQGRHGTKGNFEAVVPSSHGGALEHLWRNNDAAGMQWSAPLCFGGRARYVGTTLIQSNYGSIGNLEVLAVDDAGNLDFYWRMDRAPWKWDGPYRIASGLGGTPALIQGRHGTKGNFEAVVPHGGGGLAHLWRNNDAGMVWSSPNRFGGNARYVGASLIQSNYGTTGNLEVLAVDGAGNLDFFWRMDRSPWTWSGPFRVAAGLRGAPALIQGRHGTKGNFEAVVPHGSGGLAHLWRNNDAGMVWSPPFRFGGNARYTGAALIQGNYGSPGNLEVLARDADNNVDFFWRMDRAPWTWSGPFRVGNEVSFPVSECVYGWTARFHQADTHVSVRIQLNPDAGIPAATINTLRTTWRNGIIGKWSNRFDCLAPNGDRRQITFEVLWVSANAHHVVRVQPGPARSNMTTWDTSDTGDVASHEFGHMLGHPDEYTDAACPSRSPVNTGTVMDDNSETVARLYNGIAARHCGHTPSAAAPEAPATEIQEGEGTMRSIDSLQPEARTEVLDRLRSMAIPGEVPAGAEAAEVSFVVTGGPPGERYTYKLAVRADGTAERQVVDELAGQPPAESGGSVDRDLAARVFQAADESGLLADEAPQLTEPNGEIVPDTMIAIVTVRDGDDVRRVVVPAAEPAASADLPGEPADVPVDTPVQLPAASEAALRPLLQALSAVESAM